MTGDIWDYIAGILLVCGAGLSAIAGIGLMRFPDVLSRMHAATKPQVLGLLLALAGLGVALHEWRVIPVLVIAWLFQLLTAPVSAHLVGRATYRSRHLDSKYLYVDELAEVVQDQDEADSKDDAARS